MAATQWATIEDVAALTSVTVDAAARNLAASAIELFTGLIETVERTDISGRDRHWLRLAVCYQAAWIASQPDYLERNAVSMASQDGQSATGANPEWLTLAPNARTAIKRLSWRGIRTVSTQGATPVIANVNSDEYEDTLDWSPV